MAESLPIRHVAGADRGEFVLERDGRRVGELAYTLGGGRMEIRHTGVDVSLRGSGEARRLLDAAVEFARAGGLKVLPRCSYAEVVLGRSEQYADVLDG